MSFSKEKHTRHSILIIGYRLISLSLSLLSRGYILPNRRMTRENGRKRSERQASEEKCHTCEGAEMPAAKIRLCSSILFFLSYSPSRIRPRSTRRRAVVPSAISSQINQTFESRLSLPRPPRFLRVSLSLWYRHKTL